MRVRQYAYLAVFSETLDPGLISDRLGLLPDEVKLRGSRHAGPPPLPRSHIWQLNSGINRHDRPLGDHLQALVGRFAGHERRIRELIESREAEGVIQVVRHFQAGVEEAAIRDAGKRVGDLERLGSQHPLVGFGIEEDLLRCAAESKLIFDFDEYVPEDQ